MMSNETKRDVFVNAVDALADAQASSDNNVGLGHQDADLFMAEYENALPDDMPVIPKAVSEYIEDAKSSHYELLDAMTKWTLDQPVFDLIHDNSDTFARAWLDGVCIVDETGEIVKLEAEK